MRKAALLWLMFFCLGFGIAIGYKKKQNSLKKQRREISYILPEVKEQKKFVLLTLSYNNADFYEQNLFSMLTQKYDNYRIVYVDDASKDRTGDLVAAYLKERDPDGRVTLVRNAENCGAMANLYRQIHLMDPDEIVVTVDGDDWLSSPYVLETLNCHYNDANVWMTYGHHIEYPHFNKGFTAYTNPKTIRSDKFVASHLRSFYAGLFQKIRMQDVLLGGKFLEMTYDVAIMLPMIEMADDHARFLPDILYIYNCDNPISDCKRDLSKQQEIEASIRKLPSYSALDSLKEAEPTVDLIIFSQNPPEQLTAFLESQVNQVRGLSECSVITRADADVTAVQRRFSKVHFVRAEDFESDLRSLIERSNATHLAFALDDGMVNEPIDLAADAKMLERVKANGYYYRLAMDPEQNAIELNQDCFAWEVADTKRDFDFVLYRKADVMQAIEGSHFQNLQSLKSIWAEKKPLLDWGLIHQNAKVINLPPKTNIDQEGDI